MKLKELLPYAMDNVCIYKDVTDTNNSDTDYPEYEDLYQGKLSDAPDELLDSELAVFGAKKKGMLDIQIR